MYRKTGTLFLIIAAMCVATLFPGTAGAQTKRHPAVQRRIMAFYYPWYGTADGPGGAGRTVHWGRIDPDKKDIAASTHYPALGAYDSHDADVIDKHCLWAKAAHVDTLIVSWWGHGEYADRAMDKILDACERHGLQACIYYETTPRPQTAETAARDIIKVLRKYGGHRAYLKAHGSPVVFIYGRAIGELGLTGWLEAIGTIKATHKGGVTAIGDQFSYGSPRVFDGVHTYNTAGLLRGLAPAELETWISGTYEKWVELADRAGKISTITLIPGYDDTKIRTPGLAVERYDGQSYRIQWEGAIAADPHWILITSFNEWHEGSEIEPSAEYGDKYIELTARYAARFKSKPRADHAAAHAPALPEKDRSHLREKLQRFRIGVLPTAESMAFWWLIDLGVKPEVLTWESLATGSLTARRYPILLYCAGEHYRRTVREQGDVDAALRRYLQQGGFLLALPSRPWPFYYDESGEAVNQSHRFGLTLRMGWEQPPQGAEPAFVQPEHRLPHVPARFDFPTAGDLRWRAFFARDQKSYVPLLQLRDRGNYLGDAVAYAALQNGGHVAYAWFELFNGPHAEALLYDLFTFVADRLNP